MNTIYSALIRQLHDYAKNNQYQSAVIGLSGGLDSAVALCLAARAFGPQNVTSLILPEVGLTPNDDIEQAKMIAQHLGSPTHYQPINNLLVDFNFVTWEKSEEANQNLKAHARSLLLRHYATSKNALFIGTPNKSDLTIGYGSRFGEFAGDIFLLGDLFKSDIKELAIEIGLPDELIKKPSSRWLKPHQSDAADLGAPWAKIDDVIRQLLDDVDQDFMIEKGMDSLIIHKITRMIQQSEYKLSPTPIMQAGNIKDAINKAREAEELSY